VKSHLFVLLAGFFVLVDHERAYFVRCQGFERNDCGHQERVPGVVIGCDQIIANLNAYSLFGSDETLMEMIARRELT
jgi:hypothetical protein